MCNRLKDISVSYKKSCSSIPCASAFRLIFWPLWCDLAPLDSLPMIMMLSHARHA